MADIEFELHPHSTLTQKTSDQPSTGIFTLPAQYWPPFEHEFNVIRLGLL